jgi:hypothetical protein
MVTCHAICRIIPAILVGAEKGVAPVLEQLDPPRRAAVVMALLALTLIGLFLIVFVMVGGHWARRLARHRPKKTVPIDGARAIDERHLRQSLEAFLPDTKTDDTIHLGKAPSDTKAGK